MRIEIIPEVSLFAESKKKYATGGGGANLGEITHFGRKFISLKLGNTAPA